MLKEKVKEIKIEIEKAENILLHCHPSPDPDSVGSALAMKLALEQLGKKVTLIKGDSDIPKAFVFPHIETITPKNFFEIDLKEFDLFIILDSGSPEMISGKDRIIFPAGMTTIVIDHHASNKGYGQINLIDSSYPATAALLFDLFKEIGIKLDKNIALNLFMGIFTDTGGFRYKGVTANTLQTVSELVRLAPDFSKTIFTMENSNSKEKLIFERIILSNIKEYFGTKLVIATITNKELKENNIKKEDYSGSSPENRLISVIGFEIGVSMVEEELGKIKISFRTRDQDKYDVSKIAVELGGGGHKSAAGARLNKTIPEAIDLVVKKVKELYNF